MRGGLSGGLLCTGPGSPRINRNPLESQTIPPRPGPTLKPTHPKIRIGVLLGGNSREREVSFAGGRTVYDTLDKSIFEVSPFLVDSFGKLVLLDWSYLYKGSLRDFYPAQQNPTGSLVWLPYAEQIPYNADQAEGWLKAIGEPLAWEKLPERIDFAFLALHGRNGEDGRVQSMLDFLGLPYSGCGPVAGAWGMNKVKQREQMQAAGWQVPRFAKVDRSAWVYANSTDRQALLTTIAKDFPSGCVVKSANQGSSVGLSVLETVNKDSLEEALDRAFFCVRLERDAWLRRGPSALETLADFRSGPGFPARDLEHQLFWESPNEWMAWLQAQPSGTLCYLEAQDAETEVLIEEILIGKEFSCIVLQKPDGSAAALPPTEIVPTAKFYDYRSKYLPGFARKKTPIDLPEEAIEELRKECVRLFVSFDLEVYARIDGFYCNNGRIVLNDPNTTSGMMPSSFFFQQAAELGLSPSAFLTYLIRISLDARIKAQPGLSAARLLAQRLDHFGKIRRENSQKRLRVGVLMGGYSSERHISVESGRNIFEKLSSMEGMEPVSLFLSGSDSQWNLHQLPMHLHLKDHADDIVRGLEGKERPPILHRIRKDFEEVLSVYAPHSLEKAVAVSWERLPQLVDFVFIALHGRPGEDGTIQKRLEELGIPYNGSGPASSALTIDKYATGRLLSAHGMSVAEQWLVDKAFWFSEAKSPWVQGLGSWPLVAKPVDDGCSTGVCRLENILDLEAYAQLCFREEGTWPKESADRLGIHDPELFGVAHRFLLEQFIQARDGDHFLEITGAMMIRSLPNGQREFEVFEPSESIAGSGILSLEEKFLAGQGTNITPARFSSDSGRQAEIMERVQEELRHAAEWTGVEGYCRIDAFVSIPAMGPPVVHIIEINSLPGMTPATCIYHQAALAQYTPHQFIAQLIERGLQRANLFNSGTKP
ncbi:MAG: D-alanine--D-alanine ligase [Cytophagia bacterium]|nr:D-alanine--D-alanine ligase [Cytophagia bacterium]